MLDHAPRFREQRKRAGCGVTDRGECGNRSQVRYFALGRRCANGFGLREDARAQGNCRDKNDDGYDDRQKRQAANTPPTSSWPR
jgi:hypothetical protein